MTRDEMHAKVDHLVSCASLGDAVGVIRDRIVSLMGEVAADARKEALAGIPEVCPHCRRDIPCVDDDEGGI